jgi:hypothetical protein
VASGYQPTYKNYSSLAAIAVDSTWSAITGTGIAAPDLTITGAGAGFEIMWSHEEFGVWYKQVYEVMENINFDIAVFRSEFRPTCRAIRSNMWNYVTTPGSPNRWMNIPTSNISLGLKMTFQTIVMSSLLTAPPANKFTIKEVEALRAQIEPVLRTS